MLPEVLHQVAGELLNIQHIVLHSACKGKTLANLRVVKSRPEDAGCVEQLERRVHGHPLLRAGDAGAVLGAGGLALGDLIDKGGLAHVRDAEHHHAHDAADLPLRGVGGEFIAQQLAHSRGELRRPGAALGIGLEHGAAAFAEIRRPALRLARVGLVDAIEHDQAGLVRRHLVDVRERDARVDDLTHGVHVPDLGDDHPLRLGHVAGKPTQILNLHGYSPFSVSQIA